MPGRGTAPGGAVDAADPPTPRPGPTTSPFVHTSCREPGPKNNVGRRFFGMTHVQEPVLNGTSAAPISHLPSPCDVALKRCEGMIKWYDRSRNRARLWYRGF